MTIDLVLSISVNSKPGHPGDSYIFLAKCVRFLPVCYCRGGGGGGGSSFESEKCLTILLKKSNFLFVLKNPTATNKAMFKFLYFCTTFARTLL